MVENVSILKKALWRTIAITLLFVPMLAWADDSTASSSVDAIQILENLSSSYPALITLAKSFCYLFGIMLLMRAIFYLKAYGDLRTMTSSNTSLKIPMTYFVVAAIFLFIPSALNTFMFTLFKQNSPLAYDDVATSIDPTLLAAITGLIYFIGLLAFIRGWIMLVAIAQQSGGGQHSFGKALTHIIGGILAMNIIGFTQIIWSTFGFKWVS